MTATTVEQETLSGLFALLRDNSLQIGEMRKRLDSLIALEHQHASTRESLGRAFTEIGDLRKQHEKDMDALLTHHDKTAADLSARITVVERVQSATGPINALVQKWVIAGIGVIVLAVLSAVIAVVIVPQVTPPKVEHRN